MLSPEPMRHLSLVVLAGDLEATTRAIARVGVLHLLDVGQVAQALGAIRPYDVRARLAQLDGLARALENMFTLLGIELPAELPLGDVPPGLDLQAIEARIATISATVSALRKGMAQADEEHEELQQLLRKVRALAPVGLPLEDLRRLRYVYLTTGLLPEGNLPRLRRELAQTPHLLVPAGAAEADGRLLLTALCLSTGQDGLERALRGAQFERLELPRHLSGPPNEVTAQLEEQLAASARVLAAHAEERAALAQRLAPELQALRTVVERERLLVQARGLMGRSERVALITGWVPAMLTVRLEQAMRAATGGRCVIEWREPSAMEDVRRGRIHVPILLHNPVLIRPFERLLRNYGLPRYGEVEPTAVVALGFLAMFGFMFGDVGHGAVLFAVGYFMYRRMFRHRDYAVILMECGVFATAFGFLYGSIFGVEDWLPALWIRPMENMPHLMKTAVIFGIGFLSVGIGLNLVNALRRRDINALWERNGLLAALAYWILMAAFIRRLTAGPEAVPFGAIVVCLAVPAMLVFLKEPVRAVWKGLHEHEWPGPSELVTLLVESVVEVLDTVVSTISNTATFIRLAAFALSHAGLFLATFSVADTVARTSAGTVGAAVVIVLGNIVIICLEGLIVSIQTIRLEYYEFFSKFYSGGGEEYRPLRWASAHSGRP